MAHTRLESRASANFMDQQFNRTNPADGKLRFQSGIVFLVLPMGGKRFHEVLSTYRSECSRLGLQAVCASDAPDSGIVLKYVVEMIEKAEFIICDLSEQRPNVYYELGYAHGVGNESGRILLVATAKTCLHFDIAPLRVHFYTDSKDLCRVLRTAFKEMITLTRRIG